MQIVIVQEADGSFTVETGRGQGEIQKDLEKRPGAKIVSYSGESGREPSILDALCEYDEFRLYLNETLSEVCNFRRGS